MPRQRYAQEPSKKIHVAVILGLVIVSFYLYYISETRFEYIESQGREIAGLNNELNTTRDMLATADATIENNTKELQERANQIVGLKTQLSAKTDAIDALSRQLGIATSRVVELTPVVKRYASVGVTQQGQGVIIPLEVKLVSGSGLTSVNIRNVELLSGAQDSVRIAADVAGRVTDTDVQALDIDVSFENEGDIVTLDGASAGAAITATIIAAIEDTELDQNTLMTGTITPSGFVGRIGSVQEKAQAAQAHGAERFLVPQGQLVVVDGLDVIEVATIQDVVRLLTL